MRKKENMNVIVKFHTKILYSWCWITNITFLNLFYLNYESLILGKHFRKNEIEPNIPIHISELPILDNNLVI